MTDLRFKKFMDPENSKFRSENFMKEHIVNQNNETDSETFDNGEVKECKTANELIKNSIQRRVTRSMKKFI